MAPERELVVTPGEAGRRLDAFLASEDRAGSRARAQRLIEDGRVTVDGSARPKRHVLAEGERVRVADGGGELRPAEPGEAAPFEIVHEDPHLLVVDKPAGVVVHPAPGHMTGTLAQALATRGASGGEAWRPGIVHRLDRETSGLMVVAKSDAVHRELSNQLRRREVERTYVALVEGRPPSRTGTIDAPIGRDRSERTVHSVRTDRPRAALTHFEVVEALPRTSLLRVELETGRTHQIRVHLAAIGHPVCGDPRYGGGASGRRLGLERQFLHAAELRFTHPATGERLPCESKLPTDLSCALSAARREQASGGPDGGR